MRIPKLSYALRRIRHVSSSPFSLSSSSSPFFVVRSLHSQSPNSFFCLTNVCNNHSNFREVSRPPPLNFGFSSFTLFRSLSGHSSTNNPEKNVDFSFDGESTTESEILNLGFDNGSEVAKVMLSNDGWYVPIVQAVTSVLDQYHDLTNFPWWVIIATSTLALRVTLLPVLIVQLQKLKTIAQLFPQLPPPFPPPFSGKSYVKQFLHFRKVKRAIGCPSFLWNLAYVSVQIPCFLLWMTTIRRMSLNHHPDFDCGGALWFQNLTELPNGVFGPIFPILIAGLHYTNIQISFRNSSVGKMTGVLSLLAKYYKLYLDILTLPILVIGFYIPQGSLVYWVTNSSLTVIQQLSLNHPAIREKLGLPDKNAPVKSQTTSSVDTLDIRALDTETPRKVSVQNLSPDELLSLSIQMLAKGDKERAITLLRLALEKDPDHVRSIVVLGQTMLQKGMLTEAIENLEFAISKLFVAGLPTKDEEIDLLILSSSWAGVACIRQERFEEGLEHLQRILQLEEPQDPKGKAHYFDGLLLLASALLNNGRKDEAVEYLRKVVAYDPSKSDYLEQCLEDDGNITTNQRNSE